jgi:16S rRNA (adenine1518-N6/adenine1519-N6)-dimethyltransferase
LKTRKRFGQHFLHDPGVLKRIVQAVAPGAADALVEIGPGEGALTRQLLERVGRLIAIEIDRDLAARLSREFSSDKLAVVCADVLEFDFSVLPTRLRIVGNLPYNISTPILFHLLEGAARIIDQHLMLQKEVVDRIAASPGGRDYGRLSVMLQWRYEIERLFDVPAAAFEPPPRVMSGVLRMTPLATPPAVDAALLSQIVSVAFSQRRKLLRHTLGRWLDAHGAGVAFDLQRRAEEVAVGEYVALTQRVSAGRST